ncbi:MAG: hypothetical protein MI748_12770 [Opitutales bacterium]|nr:hypothetical protein [Opitutales bacterium]
MSLLTTLDSFYGQIRGYNRTKIRHQVDTNMHKPRTVLENEQKKLLNLRIQYALSHFPIYRNYVEQKLDSIPDLNSKSISFESFPIWTREEQNNWFEAQNGPPVPNAKPHATGGSTGKPTRLWVSRESYEWRCAVSQRGYSWAQAEDGQSVVYIWGAPAQPLPAWKEWKQNIHHKILGHTIFNSFSFGEERMAECCKLINQIRPTALVGYSGNLIALSQFVSQQPELLKWKSKTAIGAAEGLQLQHRKQVETYLANDVFMSYGSREFMLIGMEHEDHSGYWLSDDNLYTEVVDDMGNPLEPGQSGRIVVTDLRNDASPMIRYEIGDMGTMAENDDSSALPFRKLASVDGRTNEFIYLPNGERMTALFIPHLMKEFPWIEAYQIHQTDNQAMNVHFISPQAPSQASFQPVREAFFGYVPKDFLIEFTKVDSLEKRKNGKTPIVISNLKN